jgi:hypothetical protein
MPQIKADTDFTEQRKRAKEAGYSDSEIDDYEKTMSHQKTSYQKAKEHGYTDEEIEAFEAEQAQPKPPSTRERIDQSLQKTTEEFARPVTIAASGYLKGQPAVFGVELAYRGLRGLASTPSAKAGLNRENALSMMEYLYEKKAIAGIGNAPEWSEENQEELDTLQEIAEFGPEEYEGTGDVAQGIPTPFEFIEMFPGMKPETTFEKIISLSSSLSANPASIWTSLESNLGKWSSEILKPFGPKVASQIVAQAANVPIATAAVVGEEQLGINPAFTMLGLGLTKLFYQSTLKPALQYAGARYAAFDPTKINVFEPKSSFKAAKEAGVENTKAMVKSGIISPQQYEAVKPYMDIAEKYGYPMTYGSITDSNYFRKVENMMLKDDLSHPEIQKVRQAAAEAHHNAINVALQDMKQDIRFDSPGGVAESMMNEVTRKRYKDLTRLAGNGYKESAAMLKDTKGLSPEYVQRIEDSLTAIYDEIGSPLLKGETRQAVQNIVGAGRGRLSQTPNEAGRPELQGVEFETGKEALSRRASEEGKRIQEKIDDIPRLEKEAEKAQKQLDKLKAKQKREANVARLTPPLHGEPVKTAKQEKRELTEKKKAKQEAEAKQIKALQDAIDAPERAREQIKLSKQKVEKTKKAKTQIQEQSEALFNETVGEELGSLVRLNPESGKIEFINKDINGKVIVDTLKAINERLDFMNPNVMNMLQGPKKVLNEILDETYAQSHPRAVQQYRRANRLYGERERLFGDDALWQRWGLKQNVLPEDLLSTLSTLDRYKAFEKDFPQAKDFLDYFKRLKVEEKLRPVFSKARYSPGIMTNDIEKLMADKYFMYMLPAKTKANLKELQDFDLYMQRNASKFFSTTQPTPEMQTFFQFFSEWTPMNLALKLGAKVGKENLAKVYSQMLTDPKFTTKMKQIGQEAADGAKNGDISKIRVAKSKGEVFIEEMAAIGEMMATSQAL